MTHENRSCDRHLQPDEFHLIQTSSYATVTLEKHLDRVYDSVPRNDHNHLAVLFSKDVNQATVKTLGGCFSGQYRRHSRKVADGGSFVVRASSGCTWRKSGPRQVHWAMGGKLVTAVWGET